MSHFTMKMSIYFFFVIKKMPFSTPLWLQYLLLNCLRARPSGKLELKPKMHHLFFCLSSQWPEYCYRTKISVYNRNSQNFCNSITRGLNKRRARGLRQKTCPFSHFLPKPPVPEYINLKNHVICYIFRYPGPVCIRTTGSLIKKHEESSV